MSTANYLDRFLEPVTDSFTVETAQQFADMQADRTLQAHVDELAAKAGEGTLTPEEEAEYKAIVDAADLMAILRLKARRFLKQHTTQHG